MGVKLIESMGKRHIEVRKGYEIPVIFLSLMMAGLLWLGQAGSTRADGITVTSADDTRRNDGQCTLREAILNANNNNQLGSTDCASGGGSADTITFADDYTIVLRAALPNLGGELNLDGTGRRVTISGDNAVRVLRIKKGGEVTISHLTLRDGLVTGNQGGGIYVSEGATLTLRHSTLSNNFAAAKGEAVTHGGGIFNLGTLTILNSTISHNVAQAGHGGGVFNRGTLTILNSTLSGNSISENGKLKTIQEDGKSEPPPGGDPVFFGGGLYNDKTLRLSNSLIANSGGGDDCFNSREGMIIANVNNLAEDGSCDVELSGDPQLGPLQNNGGSTPTQALLPSSPAINAGDNEAAAALPFDQRGPGFPRIVNGTVDIGAFEDQGGPSCLDNVTVTHNNDSGGGSLRQAIRDVCEGGVIKFENTLASQTITLASPLAISKIVTIINPDAPGLQISGNQAVQVFQLQPSSVVTLSSLSIISGSASSGGGIRVETGATLTLLDSYLAGHSAEAGGGIYNGGQASLRRSILASNSASAEGGGIFNSGSLSLFSSTFSGNSAGGSGGGLYNQGSLTSRNVTMSSNSAGSSGGGLYNEGSLGFSNSLLANSSGGDCAGLGAITTNLNNLVEDGSCNSGASGFRSGDPRLSPLGSHGGSTLTHALLPGSVAINAGDNGSCTSVDQRGISRPQLGTCDIGAFESQGFSLTVTGGSPQSTLINTVFPGPLALTVSSAAGEPVGPGGLIRFTAPVSGASITPTVATANTTANGAASRVVTANQVAGSYNVTASAAGAIAPASFSLTNEIPLPCLPNISVANSNNSGSGSLRQALIDICDGGTIDFEGGLAGQTVALASELAITKTVTVTNPNAAGLQVSGNNTVRVFQLQPGSQVTIGSLIISNGVAAGNGGGIMVAAGATLNLVNSSLTHNLANFVIMPQGGGLYNQGTATVINSIVLSNSTSYVGGGIYNANTGVLSLVNSNVSSNSAAYGGGIFNAGTLMIIDSSLAENSASLLGGGIYNSGSVQINRSTLWINEAGDRGGGLLNFGSMSLTNSTLSGNSAATEGGGIFNFGTGTVTMLNSTLSDSSAASAGGLHNEGTLNYSNSLIGNSSGGDCTNIHVIGTNINNLVEDGSCGAALSGDPGLASLQNNGGPTLTHALLGGSPAINAGDNGAAASLTFDQRGPGFPRLQNGTVDIGSFEAAVTLLPLIFSN